MKKILKNSLVLLILIAVMIILSGCGDKKINNTEENTSKIEESTSKTYKFFSNTFAKSEYKLIFEGEIDIGDRN